MLNDPDAVLRELHRVLKAEGRLSVLDPHMAEADQLARVTSGQRFWLARKGVKTYSFAPA